MALESPRTAAPSSAAMQDPPRCPKAYPLQGNPTHLMVSKNRDPIPAAADPEDLQNQAARNKIFWSPWNFRQVTAPNTNQLGLFEPPLADSG